MKLQYFLTLVALVSVNLSCSSGGPKISTSAEGTAKRSEGAASTAHSLREQIASESKALHHHPWAGEYYEGDGLGVNVSFDLAPKSGFVFEWHGCGGLYDRNYGSVEWTNNCVHLTFTFENTRQGFQGIAPDLIPITWGDRQYLVPADDVIGFCNRVNDGSEPRGNIHGFYLLRMGDEEKPVSGFPSVSKEFQPYLVSKPIAAEIISVGSYRTRPSVADWKFKDTTVVLNAGARQGLQAGMELHVVEPANNVESVRITKVEDNQSEAIMTQMGEDDLGPKVGWRFSTRPSWSAFLRTSK